MNECTDKLQIRPDLLDYLSESDASVWELAYIHAWHTEENFSKFKFQRGEYNNTDTSAIDRTIIREFVLATAVEANHQQGLALTVSCGGHAASSCRECPGGNGGDWCNGECQWINNECITLLAEKNKTKVKGSGPKSLEKNRKVKYPQPANIAVAPSLPTQYANRPIHADLN